MIDVKSSRKGLYFWLLTLSPFLADGMLQSSQSEKASDVTACLIGIIEHLQDVLLKMSVFASADDSDMVAEVMTSVKVPLILNAVEVPLEEGLDHRTKNDLVVIVGDVDVPVLLSEVLWHRNTRFVLLLRNTSDMEGVFQAFWDHKIINVYALLNNSEDVLLYGFYPYKRKECGFTRSLEMDRWRDGGFLNDGLSKIQETNRIRNMNGCPVNVTVVDVKPNVIFQDDCVCNSSRRISGIEGKIMIEISKKFNMKANYMIALDGIGWGWIKPTPKGAVGEVYTGRSDFGIGLLAPTLERYEFLDISTHINGRECITYGVPKGAGAKQPTWLMILNFEFDQAMWFLIGFTFVVASLFFWFMAKILKLSLYKNKFDLVLYLLGSCLGLPVQITGSLTLRTALLSWILFTFIITVAYISSMGSKLTVPTPDPDINTFKELLKSDLKLNGYNNMLRLMQYNDSDGYIQLMAERFIVTDFDIDQAVDFITRDRTLAYVRHSTTFRYYALINPKAKGHIHMMKDCIYQFYPVFVMKKNSPFEKRANQIILRLNEAGIIKFWRSKYIYDVPPEGKKFVKLSLGHTFGMFFIILLGYALSMIVLIAEVVYYWLQKTQYISHLKSIITRKWRAKKYWRK